MQRERIVKHKNVCALNVGKRVRDKYVYYIHRRGPSNLRSQYSLLVHHTINITASSNSHVRMLSLPRRGLLLSIRNNFVKAIEDPRQCLKSNDHQSQMAEVVIHVSSTLLTKCTTLLQLDSCEAQHCFFSKCKNKKKLGHSSVSPHWVEQDEHNGEEFISSRQ